MVAALRASVTLRILHLFTMHRTGALSYRAVEHGEEMAVRLKIARARKGLFSFLFVAASFVGFLFYIGYLGGEVFIEVPATAAPAAGDERLAAVVLSGDMGFRIGMGEKISEGIAAHGIPVIGVNSLTYFRHRRTPAEMTGLIEAAIRRALAFGKANRVLLVGQSFGADALQVGLAGLPEGVRQRVRLVVLVVPTDTVFYRASPQELLDWAEPDADALVTARRLTWVQAVCIHGAQEAESLCSRLRLPNLRQVTLPGGHGLHHDVGAVNEVVGSAIASSRTLPIVHDAPTGPQRGGG